MKNKYSTTKYEIDLLKSAMNKYIDCAKEFFGCYPEDRTYAYIDCVYEPTIKAYFPDDVASTTSIKEFKKYFENDVCQCLEEHAQELLEGYSSNDIEFIYEELQIAKMNVKDEFKQILTPSLEF